MYLLESVLERREPSRGSFQLLAYGFIAPTRRIYVLPRLEGHCASMTETASASIAAMKTWEEGRTLMPAGALATAAAVAPHSAAL